MTFSIRRASFAVAAVGLSLGLVSCAGGQSVAAACEVANDTMTTATETFNADAQAFLTDAMSGKEVDAKATFAPMITALEETQSKVTNEKVKEPLDNFVTEFSSMADAIGSVDMSGFAALQNVDMSDPAKVEELQAKSLELQEQSAELTADLQERSEKLMKAAEALGSVCSAG